MLLYWKVKFLKRPKWKTEINVRTWAREINKISSWRDFEVYDESGEKVGLASTQWVLIDAKKGTIGRITDKMKEEYDIESKAVFSEVIEGKIKEPEDMKKICEYTIRKRDIDVNHHVNNVSYLEIAYDVLPEDVGIEFENLEIYYKKQTKFGEKVSCFYSKDGDIYTVAIKNLEGNILHAIIRFF